MPTVRAIYEAICGKMPLSLCESWDNSGFLAGNADDDVKKALIALDVTLPVIEEAKAEQCGLIVSHHPVIFHPLPSVTDETPSGRVLQSLIRNGVSVISMHTNADVCDGGVSDLLAEKLGLLDIKSLQGGEAGTLGRYGRLPEKMALRSFLEHVKRTLRPLKGARFVDAGRPAELVGVGGGACGDLVYGAASLKCDTFLTSDVKYSTMLDAKALGINLIDAGHFETENMICMRFSEIIRSAFPEVDAKIADNNIDPIEYFK